MARSANLDPAFATENFDSRARWESPNIGGGVGEARRLLLSKPADVISLFRPVGMNLNACSPVNTRKFPDTPTKFPDNVLKFPDPLSREFGYKPERGQGFFACDPVLRRAKSGKFPVFSLMIREFDAESNSHQTASSAIFSDVEEFQFEANWRGLSWRCWSPPNRSSARASRRRSSRARKPNRRSR